MIAALFALTLLASTAVDPLSSPSKPEEALAGPMGAITLGTSNLSEIRRFYADGFGLVIEGPLAGDTKALAKLWQLPKGMRFSIYRAHRPDIEGEVPLRIVVFERGVLPVHETWTVLENGPFTIGMPTPDAEGQAKRLADLGYQTLNHMNVGTFSSPQGVSYQMAEQIFKGPDNTHAVVVHRGAPMAELGAVNPATGRGGPGYSGYFAADSNNMLALMTSVLGYEIRSERVWTTGPQGAMAGPDGASYRFLIVAAKGAPIGGHVLILDWNNIEGKPPARPARLPSAGIAAWSFPVTSLKAVLANAKTNKIAVSSGPVTYKDPVLGETVRAVSFLTKEGFRIEAYERVSAAQGSQNRR